MLWRDLTGSQCHHRAAWMSDLRHSSVSEVGQDQRLQRQEAYRVIRLLRSPRPRAASVTPLEYRHQLTSVGM
ncbi:hypothetical protein NDU88_004277 [Pleurodeles waltl]|uniref:Uncharacterized protein n=1 Tax=Pleurodeles waltl TaxID=8319 RepID=A0AAV7NNW2_PLEWA|nr:hypothetical protein NDU88_004277 [Pleurodeles waltl]